LANFRRWRFRRKGNADSLPQTSIAAATAVRSRRRELRATRFSSRFLYRFFTVHPFSDFAFEESRQVAYLEVRDLVDILPDGLRMAAQVFG
jgi:hypothetical protein